jgi:hypothetical protein
MPQPATGTFQGSLPVDTSTGTSRFLIPQATTAPITTTTAPPPGVTPTPGVIPAPAPAPTSPTP